MYNFSKLNLQYRINLEEPKKTNNEFLTQLHIFF